MNKVLTLMLAAGAAIAAAAPPAMAAQGCGAGLHRGPYGRCVRNGPAVRLVIGRYYGGRGYWDGRRYWGHRYRYNGGWRYR